MKVNVPAWLPLIKAGRSYDTRQQRAANEPSNSKNIFFLSHTLKTNNICSFFQYTNEMFASCEMKTLSSYLSHKPLDILLQFIKATDKMFDQYKLNNKRIFFSH